MTTAAAPAPVVDYETCAVALTLAAVARLQAAFEASPSDHERRNLLLCAADFMDRTVPAPALKQQLQQAKPSDQVGTLVARRGNIAPVPPGLWQARRVEASALPVQHYSGVRALERYLRRERSNPTMTCERVLEWVEPVFDRYPELAAEARALTNYL